MEIVYIVAERLYDAARKIVVDTGLDGDLPIDESIADEGILDDGEDGNMIVVGDLPGNQNIDIGGEWGRGDDDGDYFDEDGDYFDEDDEWWTDTKEEVLPEPSDNKNIILIGLAAVAAIFLLRK